MTAPRHQVESVIKLAPRDLRRAAGTRPHVQGNSLAILTNLKRPCIRIRYGAAVARPILVRFRPAGDGHKSCAKSGTLALSARRHAPVVRPGHDGRRIEAREYHALSTDQMPQPAFANFQPMKYPVPYLATVLLATALGACSTIDTYLKCGFAGCAGDAQITASVEDLLRENRAIESWGIQVQTFDHVVYLYGIVDTGLERNIIESTALEVPGVVRVVNSIGIRGNVW
jgi:hypothetical protein